MVIVEMEWNISAKVSIPIGISLLCQATKIIQSLRTSRNSFFGVEEVEYNAMSTY